VSLFKRRSRSDDTTADSAVAASDDLAEASSDADEIEPLDPDMSHGARGSGGGPFDIGEVDDTGGRLDVGALLLPLVEGVELQLQLEEATGQVTGVFIILADSAVQLQAFAAPRHEGIWREICDEIATGITEQGGTADVGTGPFGYELLARVPSAQPDGRVGFQPLRFTGVDGPRWLLRAVFHGRAAVDPEAARSLEALVTDVVVVRGSEPMGPRELLPLHLPEVDAGPPPGDGDELDNEPADGLADDDQIGAPLSTPAAPRTMDDLNPFERGPEITERR
jgi:hypothetical protein